MTQSRARRPEPPADDQHIPLYKDGVESEEESHMPMEFVVDIGKGRKGGQRRKGGEGKEEEVAKMGSQGAKKRRDPSPSRFLQPLGS